MRRLTISHPRPVALLALLLLLLTACRDDTLGPDSPACEAGQPAEVTLRLELPVMEQQTRALIDEEGANFIQDLWVGIFAADGACTTNTFVDLSATSETVGEYYTLDNLRLKTLSGESRIVAVANAKTHLGLADASQPLSARKNLGTLLSAVSTWSDLLRLVTIRTDSLSSSWYTYDMVMTGYYCAPSDEGKATSEAIPTVLIDPDENDLTTGAIRLRHVMAYNKFRIRQSDSRMKVTLKSWQVCNLPARGNVMEAEGNAALDVGTQYYNKTLESTVFEPDEADFDWKTFDFYQFENKHVATENNGSSGAYVGIRKEVATDAMYADREREYKSADGTNTGVYRSLVPTYDAASLLNAATYVVIKADIDYYIANTAANIANPADAEPVAYGTAGAIHRLAEATYTIHLGYCEGKESGNVTYQTACDFNCRRNTKYTYNVTIAGVSKIIVEALSEDGSEPQPGAEGTVEDIYDDYYDLDAHYNTFNICLTNYQRSHMSWRINAPFDGTPNTLRSANYSTADELALLKQNVLYTWIKFKPAPSRTELARYKTSESDDAQWTVDELLDPVSHPHTNADAPTDPDDQSTGLWYTVFVDEYVYHQYPDGSHKEAEGGPETLWYTYINEEPRSLELLSGDIYQSSDQESTYVHTIYSISQRSIQTFYKDLDSEGTSSETAFGMEHINESYCLNMRWDDVIGHTVIESGGQLSQYNGRYNVWQTLKANDPAMLWSNVVDFAERDTVMPYTFVSTANSKMSIKHDAVLYPVPQLVPVTASYSKFDPSGNDSRYFYVNTACMNRNRDENGNGVIDKEEVKWFLPTYSTYSYAVMGENALPTPLINFYDYPASYYSAQYNTTDVNGRQDHHFAASDYSFIWAEESLSKGTMLYVASNEGSFPFNLRCVRNLGSTLSAEPTNPAREVSVPFSVDADKRIITNHYFNSACIRPSVEGYLAPHSIADDANRLPISFELARDSLTSIASDEYGIFGVADNGIAYSLTTYSFNSSVRGLMQTQQWHESALVNSLCKLYSQEPDGSDLGTWRLPNWKELTLLYVVGLVRGDYANLQSTLTCSHDYFILYNYNVAKWRYYGVDSNNALSRNVLKQPSDSRAYWPVKIRCVRDVM